MDTKELLKKVRQIEIKTRGLSRQVFAGHYHSAFKGRGMAFSEVREYRYGDDIRNIDWNVTARFNHPYVKVYDEERELTVMLLIDVSASHAFGSRERMKSALITEMAAVLSFSAINNNDKVGVIFFSDQVEKFIPPKKGSTHILRIIRELIHFSPEQRGTDIGGALKYLQSIIKKRSVVFLISDFLDHGFADALSIVSKKHDLVCIRVSDIREQELPPVGLIQFADPESGQVHWVDSSRSKPREQLRQWNQNHHGMLQAAFLRAGVDHVEVFTGRDYVPPLSRMLKQRGGR